MTPREKAEELVFLFKNNLQDYNSDLAEEVNCTLIAIDHALIVCDEVLRNIEYSDRVMFYTEVKKILKEMSI